jgi:hypothetical protein
MNMRAMHLNLVPLIGTKAIQLTPRLVVRRVIPDNPLPIFESLRPQRTPSTSKDFLRGVICGRDNRNHTKCFIIEAVAKITQATLNRMMVGKVFLVDDQISAVLEIMAKM